MCKFLYLCNYVVKYFTLLEESYEKKGYNITLGIFIGLIAGVIVGIIMPEWANTALSVVASIYMSALKMMIFPLVFTSLVMGIIGIGDIAKTGKVGLHALLWYTGTTALASGLGLVLPRMLHLGKNAHIVATKTQVEAATFMDCWIRYRILFHRIQ